MTSKIKVDNIADQDDNNIINENSNTITIGAAGDTVAVAGNIVKSNAYQASDGGNIASQSGTTITLGASGDTVTLASGASQSGFGRTGTVDWQTSSIKTATFTAANGEGYFANTSGGAFTMNLPAGSAGNIVSVVDYTNTFQTNNLTVAANGSQKIGGVQATVALDTEGQSVTFVYVDDTEGWKNVQDSTSNVTGNPFLIATGGTITTSGNCKIHTFTGPGTFTVCNVSTNCAAENIVSYMVIAGGAGGGARHGGGGGAGGFREIKSPLTPYTASPLDGYPSAPNRVTVTAQAYPITVGAGGSGQPGGCTPAGVGGVSTFSTITSAGGGAGMGFGDSGPAPSIKNGGSGGGGVGFTNNGGGSGNTPPVSPPQGQNGGNGVTSGPNYSGGGGGGATGSGGTAGPGAAGNGGAGVTTSITASPVTRAGGGGGGSGGGQGSGGSGGGGSGEGGSGTAGSGTVNTGSGGGGNRSPTGGNGASGGGGSGIVVIRYKFQ
jgi:hypothetical protein